MLGRGRHPVPVDGRAARVVLDGDGRRPLRRREDGLPLLDLFLVCSARKQRTTTLSVAADPISERQVCECTIVKRAF